MTYRLAIFDFDGTLADSFAWFLGAYDEVAAALGLRRIPMDEMTTLRSQSPREIMRRFGVPLWRMPQVAARMRALQARDIDRIALFPGITAMLEGLFAGGVTLAIVTSNAEANVRRVLGQDHAHRIAHYACGAPVFGKRSQLRQVLRCAGARAAEAIAIGDEIRDFEAATAEGISFGAVTWGYASPEALTSRGPMTAFASPSEILAKLI